MANREQRANWFGLDSFLKEVLRSGGSSSAGAGDFCTGEQSCRREGGLLCRAALAACGLNDITSAL